MTALMGLATRMRLARLYLCTDAREQQADLAGFLTAAFAGGVDVVQIRQPGMDPEAELEALEAARRVAAPHQGLVAVNGSARLAGRFGADIVHLGRNDGDPATARRHLHPWAQLGRSAHSRHQVDRAAVDPQINYFSLGAVYPTDTKPNCAPVGLDLVRHAATVAPPSEPSAKPWFAVGGINLTTIGEVIAAGARRVCVVRAITEATDPQKAAAALKDRLQEAWTSDPAMQRYLFSSGH